MSWSRRPAPPAPARSSSPWCAAQKPPSSAITPKARSSACSPQTLKWSPSLSPPRRSPFRVASSACCANTERIRPDHVRLSGCLLHRQPDRLHQLQRVARPDDARFQPVIELQLPILKAILEVAIRRDAAVRFSDLGECQIVCRDQANRSLL